MELTSLITIDEKKLQSKVKFISEFFLNQKVVVAFSGGVDSSLVAYFASRFARELLLVMQTGLSVGIGEMDVAKTVAAQFGIPLEFIEYNEFELDSNYAKNPENRCYYCKSLLHGFLEKIRTEKSYDIVVNGTNATDIQGHRPGYQASIEHNSLSPLLIANLSKIEVRYLAHKYNLPVWDKPATACLASRFTTGTTITANHLQLIGTTEFELREKFGIKQLRLRYNGSAYHLEIDKDELDTLNEEKKGSIIEFLISMGIKTIDPTITIYHSREVLP